MLTSLTHYITQHPRLGRSFSFWQRVVQIFIDARPGRLAAALSFYTIFSIIPLLILLTAIAGIFFDFTEVAEIIAVHITEYVGSQNAQVFIDAFDALGSQHGELYAVIAGIIALTFAALGAFSELQDGLNVIWDAKDERAGVRGFVIQKALSLSMIMVIGLLLLITLLASSAVSFFGDIFIDSSLPIFVVAFFDQAFSAIFVTLLFLFIFRTLPSIKVSWKSSFVGAVVSALLFLVGKSLFILYLSMSVVLSVYGNAGAILALLIFVYYVGFILYFGASVARVVGEVRR